MPDSARLADHVAACKAASRQVAALSTDAKNRALRAMADALVAEEAAILTANARDLDAARERGLSDAMTDRLALSPSRIAAMATALREVAGFDDPVGQMADVRRRPSGIEVGRMRVPLGVIAMIYEARPNVTSDAAGLCFKAGNAVVLRGGSEAVHSNRAVAAALHHALADEGLDPAAVTLVPTTDRQAIKELVRMSDHLDLVIPRGGEGLIRFVDEHSRVPVIKHYKGVCHLFVDETADLDVALDLLLDGKLSRPGVCNALETLLVHASVAADFLPRAFEEMTANGGEIRGDARTRELLGASVPEASEADYAAEFLAPIVAVRVVDGLDAALDHVARYGSLHTEVIATESVSSARRWVREVDASVVLVNASSRFSDGGELGLGAEIGISTTKLHAFGPMGLEALTTQKFVVHGAGETRHAVPPRAGKGLEGA
ncbi:glutamate-5-semialdehyde dehydrogenase [Rubrivirga sp. IMCC43871]|uniref:glutamate-5-semialdehyde dehydrogenase n=1 Tax=Rubrivirga sp. IMCC43871 TaxID=3391575 RepID=UPI003990088F